MCKNQEKDSSLLRPFDLGAVKRGDFVQSITNDEIGRFIAENDFEIIIDFERAGFVIYEEDDLCELFMKPLCWVEGKPVYKGDVLYDISPEEPRGRVVVLGYEGTDAIVETHGYNSIDFLTWTPPKVKCEGWVNIYPLLGGEQVASVSHAYVSKKSADRNAAPDRIACIHIEWEE